MKASFDDKNRQSLATVRYTNTKFVHKEFRGGVDNKVDIASAPHNLIDGKKEPRKAFYEGTSYEEFVAMVRPSFHPEMEAAMQSATKFRMISQDISSALLTAP